MKHVRRAVAATAIAGSLLLAVRHECFGQETPEARGARHAQTEASLAKQSQNPVANLVTLPLQYNYTTAGGLGENTELVLNVQPVLPLPISKDWMVVSRTVVPFVNIPLPDGRHRTGVADIEEQAFFTSAKPGKFTYGFGPVFSFPTATNSLARTGQWGLGPTLVGLVQPRQWVIGVLVNNVWRIGGASHGHVLNDFTLQPFINLNLPYAWAVSTSPLITSDWSAPEGQRWTLPIGLGVSKIAHVGDQPMSFLMQYYHNAKRPALAGSEQLRLQAALLWPTAAAQEKEKEAKEKAAAAKRRR